MGKQLRKVETRLREILTDHKFGFALGWDAASMKFVVYRWSKGPLPEILGKGITLELAIEAYDEYVRINVTEPNAEFQQIPSQRTEHATEGWI